MITGFLIYFKIVKIPYCAIAPEPSQRSMESFFPDLGPQDTPDMALFDAFNFDQFAYDNSLSAPPTSPSSLCEISPASPMYIDTSLLASPLSGEVDSSVLPTLEGSISSSDSDDFSLDELDLAARFSHESVDTIASVLAPVKRRPRKSSPESDGNNRVTKGRLPHRLVEKKYRNTLNSEFESLSRAIPHIAQLNSTVCPVGRPKPSKATILASAVNYIAKIEERRNQLKLENEGYWLMLRAIAAAEQTG